MDQKYGEFNKQIQKILSGSMLAEGEFSDYYNFIELFHMDQDALLLIVTYCAKMKGDNIGCRYIIQTAKNFAYKKLLTVKAVQNELDDYEKQNKFCNRKNLKTAKNCLRCNSCDILCVPSSLLAAGAGGVEISKYICCACGMIEDRVSLKDIPKLREKFAE